MPSITTWSRLEPHTRSQSFTSLQARIYDPIWFLTRQWQLGEFQGEDAGSPVVTESSLNTASVNWFTDLSATPHWLRYAAANEASTIPLETLVEQESPPLTLRDRIDAGLCFLRTVTPKLNTNIPNARSLLQQALVERFELSRNETVPLDDDGKRFLSIMARRTFDGNLLYEELTQSQVLWKPDQPFAKYLQPEADTLIKEWMSWFRQRFASLIHTTWQPKRLEYNFGMAIQPSKPRPSTPTLIASEYHGGHLEWHAFDANINAISPSQTVRKDFSTIPAPIRFNGMAASRFWEFEDSNVDFGAIEAAPEDLARLLLVDFALNCGNDFYFIPLKLPLGTLCWDQKINVSDTFGVVTEVQPTSKSQRPWSMFELSSVTTPSSSGLFFLAPTLASTFEARPLENVLFKRDEMLNIAWAIERTVQGVNGHPLDRFEISRPSGDIESPETSNELKYQLYANEPPLFWFPLKSKQSLSTTNQLENRLEIEDRNSARLGRILKDVVWVYDEEVPRSGTQITRSYQYARWIDGSTHIWIGRNRKPGNNEGSSGLRFDVVGNQ